MAEPRIRKAWSVKVRGLDATQIRYAPTASVARTQAITDLRDAWDIKFGEALRLVTVHREPEADTALPDRHPLAPQIDPRILHCVVHAYGGTGMRAGYRDHFYTYADDWELKAGLYHGLFRIFRRDPGRNGQPDQIMYVLTALGRNVARGEAETYPRW